MVFYVCVLRDWLIASMGCVLSIGESMWAVIFENIDLKL